MLCVVYYEPWEETFGFISEFPRLWPRLAYPPCPSRPVLHPQRGRGAVLQLRRQDRQLGSTGRTSTGTLATSSKLVIVLRSVRQSQMYFLPFCEVRNVLSSSSMCGTENVATICSSLLILCMSVCHGLKVCIGILVLTFDLLVKVTEVKLWFFFGFLLILEGSTVLTHNFWIRIWKVFTRFWQEFAQLFSTISFKSSKLCGEFKRSKVNLLRWMIF